MKILATRRVTSLSPAIHPSAPRPRLTSQNRHDSPLFVRRGGYETIALGGKETLPVESNRPCTPSLAIRRAHGGDGEVIRLAREHPKLGAHRRPRRRPATGVQQRSLHRTQHLARRHAHLGRRLEELLRHPRAGPLLGWFRV